MSHFIYCYAECHNVDCRYAECYGADQLSALLAGGVGAIQLYTPV